MSLPTTTFSVRPLPLKNRVSRVERWVSDIGIARLAWVSCLVSIAALVVGVALNRQADLRHTHAVIDARISINAKGYAKFVSLIVTVIDQQLVELRDFHVLMGRKLPAQDTLDSKLTAVPGLLLEVMVVDANGIVIDSSLEATAGKSSIFDERYFVAALNNPADELFISRPTPGDATNQLQLRLIRPIRANGRFVGAIIARIDPQLLKTYFTDVNVLNDDGVLTIVGKDGLARFRMSSAGFSAGDDLRGRPNWNEVTTQPFGIFQNSGSPSSSERRVAFHEVDGYPLVVVLSTGYASDLSDFARRWFLIGGLALVLAAVLILVAGTVTRLAAEQKRSYELLLESRAREIEGNQVKANFLSSVSHEFRTPLNSILGFSELIRDTCAEPKISQYAELINHSGTQLHALVNTILDLAKIDSGKMGLTVEAIDVPELLRTLIAVYKVNADQKKVELSLSVHALTREVIHSDRTKLAQVIHNVLDNALKFTEAGGVFIVLKPFFKEGLLITVIDSGIGMSAGDALAAFERFNTTTSGDQGGRGPGLGLTLCRELLTLMEGTIRLVSEEGQGTTVDIFIPYQLERSDASK